MEYPSEAKYMKIRNYNDKVLARHTTRITPFNGGEFGPTKVDRILWNIPSETGMEIDMDTLMIHFDVTIVPGTGTAATHDYYFNNSIESIIQALRIRKGTSFLLEDIQRYNYLDSMFMNYVSDDYNKCVGAATMGIGDAFERIRNHKQDQNNLASNLVARNYAIPLRLSGISQYSGLISTSLIDSVAAFQIEIELAPANQCLQAYASTVAEANIATIGTADATATYTVSKCYISYDLVRMAPEYHAQLQSSISRGVPLQIPYKTWRTSLYSLPSTTTSSIVYNINDTVKSLNAVYVAFFDAAEQNQITIPGRDRKHFPTNLKTAQLQLGSFYYPLQPMDCENRASQVFLEVQKAMGLTFVRSEYTGPFGFDGDEFTTPYTGGTFDLVTGFAANAPAARSRNGITIFNPYAAQGVKFGANAYAGPLVRANGDALGTAGGANAATETASSVRFMREATQNPCEFMLAFNLRKVLDVAEGEIVGTDIQSSGSGLMSLRLEFSGAVGKTYNVIVASLYDAVLEIQSNQQTFRVE